MNINIRITTKSGSIYELYQRGDKLFFNKGCYLSGEIVKLHQEIRIGGILDISFTRDGLYSSSDSMAMSLRSTSITNIVVG